MNEAIEDGLVNRDGLTGLVCECGRLGCNSLIELTLAEYELVRAEARQFVVVAGHQTRLDHLVRHTPGYDIVASRRSCRRDRPARRGDLNRAMAFRRLRASPSNSPPIRVSADIAGRPRRRGRLAIDGRLIAIVLSVPAIIRLLSTSQASALARIRRALALIGFALPLVSERVTFIGSTLTRIGNPFPAVGHRLTRKGLGLALLHRPLPLAQRIFGLMHCRPFGVGATAEDG